MQILAPFIGLLLVAALIRLMFPGGRAMDGTRKKVIRRVYSEYPAEAEHVLSELDSYSGPEPDRVMMDILILSAGSLENLKRWIRMANNDYRDVLAAAEYSDGETGAEILRTFHERRPDNSVGLSFEDLMREDPLEEEPPNHGAQAES